jgi:hypothetical protein
MAMSPRSERIQKEADVAFEQACEEAVEDVVAEAGLLSSSEDEDEQEGATLKKKLKQLEKEAEFNEAKKEVETIFGKEQQMDVTESEVKTVEKHKIAEVARKLANWKRKALKAAKEVRRIKRECSCGRAVNYPWIFRK